MLLVSYRGFSESEGKGSEEGLKMDANAMLDFAINFQKDEEKAGRRKELFLYGRSLGGAVALHLAAQNQYKDIIRGVILENTFTSIGDLILKKLPYFPFIGFLGHKQWRSKDLIQEMTVPLMFIRSSHDMLIEPSHMQELIKLSSKSKVRMDLLVLKAKHEAVWILNPPVFTANLNNFFKLAEQETPPDKLAETSFLPCK